MKPATGVVLLLAVVLGLYFVSLGLGLVLNRDAPRVDLRTVDCNGQPVTGIFKLTEPKAQCTLAFVNSVVDKYRKGELDFLQTPTTSDVVVFVHEEFEERHFKKADRDPSKCFIDPLPVAGPVPLAPEMVPLPPEVLQSPLRLQIQYGPNEKSEEETWKCWLVHDRSEPYRFTVLRDGGSLALECVGCAAGAQRELSLRLK